MNPTPTKSSEGMERKWLRFHLSTLLLLALSVSLFLAVNIRPDQTIPVGDGRFAVISSAGWPFEYRTEIGFQRFVGSGITLDIPDSTGPIVVMKSAMERYRPLIADAVLALVVLIGLVVLSEARIRRREAKNA